MGKRGLDPIASTQGTVTESCEYDIEILSSIDGGKFLGEGNGLRDFVCYVAAVYVSSSGQYPGTTQGL
jgi:hypothetical protein